MTNACIYDCEYCVNRKSHDILRVFLSPEEIATLTIEFYRRNYIEGLFLSSGLSARPIIRQNCSLKRQGFFASGSILMDTST